MSRQEDTDTDRLRIVTNASLSHWVSPFKFPPPPSDRPCRCAKSTGVTSCGRPTSIDTLGLGCASTIIGSTLSCAASVLPPSESASLGARGCLLRRRLARSSSIHLSSSSSSRAFFQQGPQQPACLGLPWQHLATRDRKGVWFQRVILNWTPGVYYALKLSQSKKPSAQHIPGEYQSDCPMQEPVDDTYNKVLRSQPQPLPRIRSP